MAMNQQSPKIDCYVSVKPVHRYLVKTKTTKYSLSQEVERVFTRYHIQWQNLEEDIRAFMESEWSLRYAMTAIGGYLFYKTSNPVWLILHGALTLDVAVESNNTASFSVTVASNSDRMMIMGFGHYQGGNNISAASYNSVSLTEVKAQAGSFGERAGIWGLVAPSTGTNTFSITGNDSWSGYGVISIYDADQNLPATTGGASGDSGTASASLTTTVANAWVVAAIGAEPAITMSTSGGVEDMNEQGASYQNAEMHHVAKATAGSQTMSASLGYGARWNIALCEVKPVSGGGGGSTPSRLALLGIG